MDTLLSTRSPSGSLDDEGDVLTTWQWLLLLAVILAVAGYRLFIAHVSGLNLFLDEAYYLGWSQAPALGYYSKPPMIAWSLAAVTSVCGDGELCVKATALLWYAVAAVFVALTAARLFGRETGLLAGVALYTMPAVGLLSLTVSTDGPLLAFWALSLWLYTLAVDERPGAWVALGVAMGLGLLSKYTMVLFPVSMVIALVLSPDRAWLRMRGPWLALGIALLVFAPNLWWNAVNGFPSLAHTAELAQWSGEVDHAGELLEFLAGQLGVFGLLSFPLLLVMILRAHSWRDPVKRMLLLFTLPLLLMYAAQAWLGGAYINWALASYIAATVLLVGQLLDWGRVGGWLLAAVLAVNIGSNLVLYHWQSIAPVIGVELSRRTDPWSRILGWREMGEQVSALRAAYPEAELLGDSRAVLALISYYARPWPGVAAWNPDGGVENQYELTADITTRQAGEYLYVGDLPPDAFAEAFAEVEVVGSARHEVYPDRVLEVSVYRLAGFRGYPAGAEAGQPPR